LWQIAAGLGLFLFGMGAVEAALRDLLAGSLRAAVRRQARTPIRGLAIGTMATAILQSSSLVMVLTLAFVGIGVIDLRSAIGVVAGANIGTSATGWLVVFVGFKLDLAEIAYELIAVGGIGAMLVPRGPQRAALRLAFGVGLLLLGLEWMKDGVEDWAAAFDVSPFAGLGVFAMAAIGLALTAVIQSSSGTMLIALTALHSGVIELPGAAALMVGANVGTTVTSSIAAIGGTPDKKRVAAFHVIFNTTTALVVLPLLAMSAAWLGRFDDPLIALSAFHTLFNVLGASLFMPFTARIAAWLGRWFNAGPELVGVAIHRAGIEVPSAGVEAMAQDLGQVIALAVAACRTSFGLAPTGGGGHGGDAGFERLRNVLVAAEPAYVRLKRLEGELVDHGGRLQRGPLDADQAQRIEDLLESIRRAVLAAKAMKDVSENWIELQMREQPGLSPMLAEVRSEVDAFLRLVETVLPGLDKTSLAEDLARHHERVRGFFDRLMRDLYLNAGATGLEGEDLSSLLNLLRETRRSQKSLLRAIARWRLGHEQASLLEQAYG
jgi:phosphate:Na+ symporter